MLQPYAQYGAVFVEITRNAFKRGGPGWDFGTCLWIPTRNATGADRYALIRQVSPGNLILHINAHDWDSNGVLESRLCGSSIAMSTFKETSAEPPVAGSWSGRAPYYRVELAHYSSFAHPVRVATLRTEYGGEIQRDLVDSAAQCYPFNTYADGIRTVQGIYLARCTPRLYEILMRALKIEAAAESPTGAVESHCDYVEGQRLSAERYFFARNPNLVRDAKAAHGKECQVCQFDFEDQFGSVGKDFIEAHHLDPLSERSESEWTEELRTSIDQIAVLCSNCHRIVHRRRPAYSLEEIRGFHRKATDSRNLRTTAIHLNPNALTDEDHPQL
jgi:hypothetical protein